MVNVLDDITENDSDVSPPLTSMISEDKNGAHEEKNETVPMMIIQQIESMVNALIHNDELLNEVIEREQFWSVLDQYVGQLPIVMQTLDKERKFGIL